MLALTTPAPPLLVSPLAVALICALCLAAGRRLAGVLGVRSSIFSYSERGVVYLGLGAGALAFVPFALGAVGQLSVTTVRLALAVLCVPLAVDLLGVARAALARRRPEAATPAWKLALLGALLPALVASFLVALSPTLDPDGLSYHLTAPKRWLEDGRLVYLPTYMFSNTPMGVEMLFTLGLAAAGDTAAKLLHWCLGVAGAVAVFHAGERLGSKAAGATSAVLFIAGPLAVTKLLGLAYIEGAVAFAIAVATLTWLAWLQHREASLLRVSALLVGFSVTFKITAALFAVAMTALTLFAIVDAKRRQRVGLTWGAALGALALMAVPALPWFVRSAIVTGNPLFPLFARLVPTRDLTPETAKSFDHYNRYFLWASRYAESWSLETRQAILAGVASLVLVAAGLSYLKLRGLPRAATVVLGLAVALQLSAVGLYSRYWVPILPTLLLPVLSSCDGALRRLAKARWALVALTALGSLYQAHASFATAKGDVRGVIATATGLETYPTFLRRNIELYPMFEYINRELPRSSRVALTYTCIGFYIDATTYCSEFPQDALGFTSWENFVGNVRKLGVTHFMAPTCLTRGEVPPPDYSGPAIMQKERKDAYLTRLLSSHGRLLAVGGDQGLYELHSLDKLEPTAALSMTR
jgi:hypothetical protein